MCLALKWSPKLSNTCSCIASDNLESDRIDCTPQERCPFNPGYPFKVSFVPASYSVLIAASFGTECVVDGLRLKFVDEIAVSDL